VLNYLRNKIWPIRDAVRVLAGQFQSAKGMRMVMHRSASTLHFTPSNSSDATTLMLGFPVTELTISICAGKAEILSFDSAFNVALNRREQELLGQAANKWLEFDNLESQVEVLP
jgi:hypothetical protein